MTKTSANEQTLAFTLGRASGRRRSARMRDDRATRTFDDLPSFPRCREEDEERRALRVERASRDGTHDVA